MNLNPSKRPIPKYVAAMWVSLYLSLYLAIGPQGLGVLLFSERAVDSLPRINGDNADYATESDRNLYRLTTNLRAQVETVRWVRSTIGFALFLVFLFLCFRATREDILDVRLQAIIGLIIGLSIIMYCLIGLRSATYPGFFTTTEEQVDEIIARTAKALKAV